MKYICDNKYRIIINLEKIMAGFFDNIGESMSSIGKFISGGIMGSDGKANPWGLGLGGALAAGGLLLSGTIGFVPAFFGALALGVGGLALGSVIQNGTDTSIAAKKGLEGANTISAVREHSDGAIISNAALRGIGDNTRENEANSYDKYFTSQLELIDQYASQTNDGILNLTREKFLNSKDNGIINLSVTRADLRTGISTLPDRFGEWAGWTEIKGEKTFHVRDDIAHLSAIKGQELSNYQSQSPSALYQDLTTYYDDQIAHYRKSLSKTSSSEDIGVQSAINLINPAVATSLLADGNPRGQLSKALLALENGKLDEFHEHAQNALHFAARPGINTESMISAAADLEKLKVFVSKRQALQQWSQNYIAQAKVRVDQIQTATDQQPNKNLLAAREAAASVPKPEGVAQSGDVQAPTTPNPVAVPGERFATTDVDDDKTPSAQPPMAPPPSSTPGQGATPPGP